MKEIKIKVEHFTKVIGKCVVLDDINLEIESGKIYGVHGCNGSGKTMLMRAIAGLIYSDQGHVEINGSIIGKNKSFPDSLGILLETPSFLDRYNGYKNLKILADIKGNITEPDIKDALMRVGLDPEDRRIYKKYSLGMKQRLGIACAIMEKPDILLIDEPTNALDQEGIDRIEKIITEEKERGALILIASHEMQFLNKIADEMIGIKNGKIVD